MFLFLHDDCAQHTHDTCLKTLLGARRRAKVRAFSEDARRSFELRALGAPALRAANIRIDKKLADVIARDAHGDVGQHAVESLELVSAAGSSHDSSVLSKDTELEGADHGRCCDERSSRSRRWELPSCSSVTRTRNLPYKTRKRTSKGQT